jgi:hypothetical protein
MTQATPRNGQTLRNVPVFVSYEAVERLIGFASPALVNALIEATGASVVAKRLTVRSTSSDPRKYGSFAFHSCELIARYDEDRRQWIVV